MNPMLSLMLLPALAIGLTVHEFAHAWVASLLGDNFARRNRRVSLNPFRHLSLLGTLAIFLLPFGWAKPVPINAYNFKRPKRDYLLVSLAGPGANLIVAALCWGVMALTANAQTDGLGGALLGIVNIFALLILLVNVVLAVVNLLPIPPLDGSAIWPVLIRRMPIASKAKTTWIWIGLLMLLFWTNSHRYVLDPIISLVANAVPVAATAGSRLSEEIALGNEALREDALFIADYHYSAALDLDLEDPTLWAIRAHVRHLLLRHEEALADIERAVALAPDDADYLERREALRERVRSDRAREACQSGERAFADEQDYADAEAHFTRAIGLDPDESFYHDWRARARVKQGKWADALADANRAIELFGQWPAYYEFRAVILKLLGQDARAEADLARAKALKAATRSANPD